MFLRPPFIQNNKEDDYKDARLEYFVQHILPNYDVVCLQEVFAVGSSRTDRLLAAAEKQGFKYSVVSEKQPTSSLGFDGGIVILSKHPIVDSERHDYKPGTDVDYLIKKGVLYAKLAIYKQQQQQQTGEPATYLHVFNTHTQASYTNVTMTQPHVRARLSQLHEFHNFLESTLPKHRQAGEAVILAGDYNVDRRTHKLSDPEHYKYERNVEDGKDLSIEGTAMLDIMQGKGIDPKILGPDNTESFKGKVSYEIHDILREKLGYGPVTFGNTYVDANGTVQPMDKVLTGKEENMVMNSIDYILWHNPDAASQKHGVVASVKDVAVTPNFTPGQLFTQISDHYGVSAQIHFEFK
ncbi:hypothetical protein GGI12_003660 [Dipsacomyces acuminosporus]|nr:hypothetical protein GGI12_003660 [Dipsacomyces acuminosporus]